MSSDKRGDGDLDDAVGRPRPLRPLRRAAHDAAADAPEPATARGRRGADPLLVGLAPVDGLVDEPISSGATGASTSGDGRRRGRRGPVRRRPADLPRSGRSSSTGNDASRQPIASSRPVTLNATCVAIDMPRRSVTIRQAPATRAKANRPGVLDGPEVDDREPRRGHRARRRRARCGRRTTAAAGRGRRSPRRSARPTQTITTSSTIVPPLARSASFSAVSDSRSSENVSGQSARSGMYTSGTSTSWVRTPIGRPMTSTGPEADAVVLDRVAGPRPLRRHVAPDEVGDPRRQHAGEERRDRHLVGRLGAGRGDDGGRHELAEDERDDPRDDGDLDVDRPPGITQRRASRPWHLHPHGAPR